MGDKPPAYSAPGYQSGYPPQQGGYGPPPQGYAPPPQGYAPPSQGYAAQTHTSNVTVVSTGAPTTVRPGGCPVCGVGLISDEFTVAGIILAILFFPLGVLCCFLMMEKRCSSCGARF